MESCLFRCFWAGIVKNYCHIRNQRFQIHIFPKLCKEKKMPTL